MFCLDDCGSYGGNGNVKKLFYAVMYFMMIDQRGQLLVLFFFQCHHMSLMDFVFPLPVVAEE
jgi:hypothetical protein